MKHLLTEKAEKLVEKHHEKYQRQNSESFREMQNYDHSDHLINLASYGKDFLNITLTPKQQEIVNMFYGTNNDNAFNALFSDFMIQLGTEARDTYGRTDQQSVLYKGINPIIQKIAIDLFIRTGMKTILNKQAFQHI